MQLIFPLRLGGTAVPGYDVAVLDDANRPMAGGTGRLAVRGSTGCCSLDDDDRQRVHVVCRRDEEGYFHFVARSDDMIVSSGYDIGAPEVENALVGHPAVRECAVAGTPCPQRGMKVKAFVVAAPGQQPEPGLVKTLHDHAKAQIGPYQYPREIVVLDALPKTATGKIQRFALRHPETQP